jgi:hypothetical protein
MYIHLHRVSLLNIAIKPFCLMELDARILPPEAFSRETLSLRTIVNSLVNLDFYTGELELAIEFGPVIEFNLFHDGKLVSGASVRYIEHIDRD